MSKTPSGVLVVENEVVEHVVSRVRPVLASAWQSCLKR